MNKSVHSLKWELFEDTLLERDLKIFTLNELRRIFKVSNEALKHFLVRWIKRGKVLRLKRGVYCLKRNRPTDFLVANKLYQPSYISLEFALSYFGIIPESIYAITSVTSKPTRQFFCLEKQFVYLRIKKEAFGGYTTKNINNLTIFVATPEKAVADYFYFILLGKKKFNERIDWKKFNQVEVKRILKESFGVKNKRLEKFFKGVEP